jgi:hypothetical protein
MTGRRFGAALLLVAMLLTGGSEAARESKISATKHNLSSTGTGTTHSTTESQICVFCHTPHGADTSQSAPLWNKTLANTTYTPYTSSSLDAATIQGASAGQPLGSSKLCLSCHDGVMALGSVRVLRGQQNQTIGGGTEVAMPAGSGSTTGYTRLLGTDLTNDHPISVTFDATLSDRDGELRRPTMSTGAGGQTLNRWGTVVGVRGKADSYKPMLPLEPTGSNSAGQVQCTTCHDPHIRETNLTAERNIKFLRANRFQKAQPTSSYVASNDIVCLSCHDKGMQGVGGNTWAYSVHANANVATQTYKTAAADTREFPSTTSLCGRLPASTATTPTPSRARAACCAKGPMPRQAPRFTSAATRPAAPRRWKKPATNAITTRRTASSTPQRTTRRTSSRISPALTACASEVPTNPQGAPKRMMLEVTSTIPITTAPMPRTSAVPT